LADFGHSLQTNVRCYLFPDNQCLELPDCCWHSLQTNVNCVVCRLNVNHIVAD
jgi:hypothetical protein